MEVDASAAAARRAWPASRRRRVPSPPTARPRVKWKEGGTRSTSASANSPAPTAVADAMPVLPPCSAAATIAPTSTATSERARRTRTRRERAGASGGGGGVRSRPPGTLRVGLRVQPAAGGGAERGAPSLPLWSRRRRPGGCFEAATAARAAAAAAETRRARQASRLSLRKPSTTCRAAWRCEFRVPDATPEARDGWATRGRRPRAAGRDAGAPAAHASHRAPRRPQPSAARGQ